MRMLPLQAGSSLLTTYSLSSTPKPGPATGRLSLRAGSCSCLQLGCWSWLGDWRVLFFGLFCMTIFGLFQTQIW